MSLRRASQNSSIMVWETDKTITCCEDFFFFLHDCTSKQHPIQSFEQVQFLLHTTVFAHFLDPCKWVKWIIALWLETWKHTAMFGVATTKGKPVLLRSRWRCSNFTLAAKSAKLTSRLKRSYFCFWATSLSSLILQNFFPASLALIR